MRSTEIIHMHAVIQLYYTEKECRIQKTKNGIVLLHIIGSEHILFLHAVIELRRRGGSVD